MKHFICFLVFAMSFTVNFACAKTLNSLPMPTGPYQIGITKYDLIDPFRKEIESPSGRLIPIQIYFPIKKGINTIQNKMFEKRAPEIWPPLDVNVYSQMADLSLLGPDSKHPVIFLNHGDTIAMTEYAYIAEDLASHGYVVVAIQHQLKTDPEEPKFWKGRSISLYGRIIDNILYVFKWLQEKESTLFNGRLDLKKIGLIGHSMSGNSLLAFADRATNVFKKKENETLLPYKDTSGVKEAIIALDPRGFSYPPHKQYPLFLLLSQEQESYQKKMGTHDDMIKIGYRVKYYKGSKHVSFMDQGYVDPQNPFKPNEHYFNGTLEERKEFFNEMRKDIRNFLNASGITEPLT